MVQERREVCWMQIPSDDQPAGRSGRIKASQLQQRPSQETDVHLLPSQLWSAPKAGLTLVGSAWARASKLKASAKWHAFKNGDRAKWGRRGGGI